MDEQPAPLPTTLENTLRPHAIPTEELLRRHPAVVPLVGRILGVIPRSFSYQEIWPPAFTSYGLTVPVFFDLPFCDAGLGIGPKARSLVAYAASRGHGCMYCSAHCATLGSVFTGSEINLEQNAASISDGVCQIPAPKERALIDFGMAVAQVPAAPLDEEMRHLEEHFSPSQIERIVLAAANMGMLNRCMDTFGMVLEGQLLKMARAQLSQSGWEEGPTYNEERDRALLDAEEAGPQLPDLGPFELLQKMAAAVRFESRALAGIPKSAGRLDALLEQRLGFVPYYMHRFSASRVRRTLAHLLLERWMSESEGVLGPALRCAMGLVAARTSENEILAAHFGYLGERVCGREEFQALLECDQRDARTVAALEFARVGSTVPPTIEPELVARLAAEFTPQARVELVLVLSIYSCLQRMTVAYPPTEREPAIERFMNPTSSC